MLSIARSWRCGVFLLFKNKKGVGFDPTPFLLALTLTAASAYLALHESLTMVSERTIKWVLIGALAVVSPLPEEF
jgi:hypothetical protein